MQIAGIDMVIGQKYTLTMCVREGGNRGVTQIRKRMKLVGLYPHNLNRGASERVLDIGN